MGKIIYNGETLFESPTVLSTIEELSANSDTKAVVSGYTLRQMYDMINPLEKAYQDCRTEIKLTASTADTILAAAITDSNFISLKCNKSCALLITYTDDNDVSVQEYVMFEANKHYNLNDSNVLKLSKSSSATCDIDVYFYVYKKVSLITDIKVNSSNQLVVTKGGADTVLNFSLLSNHPIAIGTVSGSSSSWVYGTWMWHDGVFFTKSSDNLTLTQKFDFAINPELITRGSQDSSANKITSYGQILCSGSAVCSNSTANNTYGVNAFMGTATSYAEGTTWTYRYHSSSSGVGVKVLAALYANVSPTSLVENY